MKIWLLTTEFPPFFGGGIATYCLHTLQMLHEQGHEVTVFTPDGKITTPIVEQNCNGTARVVRFKPGASAIYQTLGYSAAQAYQFCETVAQYIQADGPPDLIESQDYLGIAYFILQQKLTLDAMFRGIPVIITLHAPNFIIQPLEKSSVYRFPDFFICEMERFCLRAADAIIAPSQYMRNTIIRELGLDESQITVIPNPYRPALSEVGSTPVQMVAVAPVQEFVFLGRLQHSKGIFHILRYFAAVWEKGIKVPLRVLGGDTLFKPQQRFVGEIIRENYADYIHQGLLTIAGNIPPSELQAVIGLPLAVIVGSLFEAFSYAVVECMAAGKVVLASASGGQRELIAHGKNGLLFEHAEPATFHCQVEGLLAMAPVEHAQVSRNARQRSEVYCDYGGVYEKKQTVFSWLDQRRSNRSFPFIRPRTAPQNMPTTIAPVLRPGLLSVVIPYYNMGQYLLETLESLAQSTYPAIEVIIVNDGSTDKHSLAVLASVPERFALLGITIVVQTNSGLAVARNIGASHAHGEYLAFLDPDDIVMPDYYRRAIEILRAFDNVYFVGCWLVYFGDGTDGTVFPTWNPEPPYLLYHNMINSSSLVYKTTAFLTAGQNDPAMEYGMEDYDSVIGLLEQGYHGVAIPEVLFRYRVRKDSMMRRYNRESVLYLYRLIAEKHSAFFGEYAAPLSMLLNANGPGILLDNPTWESPYAAIGHPQHSQDVAADLRTKLRNLWHKPSFQRLVKLVFYLRIDRLFR